MKKHEQATLFCPTPVPLSCAFIKTQTYLVPCALYNILSITVNLVVSYFQGLRKENTESGKHWIWLCEAWGLKDLNSGEVLYVGIIKIGFTLKTALLQTIWPRDLPCSPLCPDTQCTQQIPREAAVSFHTLLLLLLPTARLQLDSWGL